MAIIFAILKTILKILLIILALIIILILLILFVPFRYRAAGVKEPGTIEAEASVTWLLHMLTVEIGYELSSGKGLTKDVRLFGISLFKVRDWLEERRKSKAEKEKEKRRQEKRKKLERMKTEDPERYEQLRAEALARKEEKRKAEEERKRLEEEKQRLEAERAAQEALKKKQEEEERIRLEKQKAEEERIRLEAEKAEVERVRLEAEKASQSNTPPAPKPSAKEVIRQKTEHVYLKMLENILKIISRLLQFLVKLIVILWHLPGKIIQITSNVCRKIDSVGNKVGNLHEKISDLLDFLQDEHTQEVLSLLKKQIGRLLGHILPKKLTGYLQFGLEDPYLTGRVLATACAFYPLYGRTFRLEPDFEELVLNGRAELKGRIYLFYLAFIALSTYFNKNTKYVINYIKSFRNKEEAE